MNRNYHFDYNPFMEMFLAKKGIKHYTSDADITLIEIVGHDDSNFIKLIGEFNEWLRIELMENPFKYHQG
jgi:hypothetical protein